MSNNTISLFGFPVVITDVAPKGQIVFGRFPTWQDILEHGSFKAAIEAQKEQWVKIEISETDNQ